MIPARNRVAPAAGDGNVQSPARSTTHFCSDSGVPMARPTATLALPPPEGTANTRSRRAPSVSSYWRAAHSHDSMSTLWLTTTAHSSAAQNRGRGPLASSTVVGWVCAHEATTATIANRHLRPDATSATYQILARDLQSSKMAPVGASKVLVWSIVLGIAFAIGMVLLVNKVTQTSRDRALAETNAEVARMESPRGPSMLDAAAAVASPFVAHIAAGRHADAYALLAAPY